MAGTTGLSTCPDVAAYYSDAFKSLNVAGISTTAWDRSIPWTDVKIDIDQNQPITASIQWRGKSSGHDFVIYGYYEDGVYKNVSYMDPWPTSAMWNWMPYSDFVSNESFYWKWTFMNNARR
ncbi:hypothetical protein DYI95_008850 [Thermaerobacter sp. PB12/4term]|uniref:C39 family peptidase n=1 Tax=Thermaerobacter sp. PB12/4term TaxID=2293838 RepID=UPI0013144C3A|nr:hypothetical protein DYI95_008850 [Thermaerobacter sp. PB12/4term]